MTAGQAFADLIRAIVPLKLFVKRTVLTLQGAVFDHELLRRAVLQFGAVANALPGDVATAVPLVFRRVALEPLFFVVVNTGHGLLGAVQHNERLLGAVLEGVALAASFEGDFTAGIPGLLGGAQRLLGAA